MLYLPDVTFPRHNVVQGMKMRVPDGYKGRQILFKQGDTALIVEAMDTIEGYSVMVVGLGPPL